MEDIARAAGYATGATYRYFSSKEELFLRLMERQMKGLMVRVRQAAKSARTAQERVHEILHAQIEFASQDVGLMRLYFSEGVEVLRSPESHRRIERLRRQFEKWFAAVVAGGQAAGEFRAGEPRLFTMVIQGMVGALFRQWAGGSLSPRVWREQARFVSLCALQILLCNHSPP